MRRLEAGRCFVAALVAGCCERRGLLATRASYKTQYVRKEHKNARIWDKPAIRARAGGDGEGVIVVPTHFVLFTVSRRK